MRAATFTGYGEPLPVREVRDPTIDEEGALVEVEACGVCRSDWHAWMGDWHQGHEPGHVFGHEPAGTVVEVGDAVETVSVGDHVTIPFNLGDGDCPRCRRGQSNLCEHSHGMGVRPGSNGAFAELLAVPDADVNVVQLPPGVSSIDMAGLGCRFMTAFHALAHRADVDGGDWLAVHGCGGVGQSAVTIAAALGANVVAVDLDDGKLETARALGAVETVNAAETDDVPGAVAALTDGGAHVSVDALGIAETCRNSIESLRTRGQHVQVGLTTKAEGGEVTLPTDMMVQEEITMVGSFGMPVTGYPEIFRMMETGSIDPGTVVSETISLEAVGDTLAAMTNYGTAGIPVIDRF